MKYRLGKKQKRAILNDRGEQVALFEKGFEHLANLVCVQINNIEIEPVTDKEELLRKLLESSLRTNELLEKIDYTLDDIDKKT